MDYPTPEALALVDEFSTNDEVRDSLCLCLSETPIGDEYEVCSELDWERFAAFLEFAEGRGVRLFAPPEPEKLTDHDQIVRLRCKTADWPYKTLERGEDGNFRYV